VVGTIARRGIDAYHAIHAVLSGRAVLSPVEKHSAACSIMMKM
jgi:hypothetical protein